MKNKVARKSKPLVCVICKGDKKIQSKNKCCSSKMVSPKKGSWNL